jgi:hypothetical protein
MFLYSPTTGSECYKHKTIRQKKLSLFIQKLSKFAQKGGAVGFFKKKPAGQTGTVLFILKKNWIAI